LKYCAEGFYSSRIIIPIKDHNGNQISFEARAINKEVGIKKNLFPKGSQINRLLFNLDIAKCFDTCWVVEGLWDVLRLYSYGEENVVGLFGTNLSQYQAEILIRNFRKIYLILDGDEAGRKAQDKMIKILNPYMDVADIRLAYDDPDDMSVGDLRELKRQYNIK
jgi:DNA primase